MKKNTYIIFIMEIKGTGVYIVGTHVSKDKFKDMSDAIISRFVKMPSSAVQIFTHGPLKININNNAISMNEGIDIEKLKKISKQVNIFVHAPYTQNIFKDDKKSFDLMLDVMKTSEGFNSSGVVIHLPRGTVNTVLTGIKRLMDMMDEQKLTTPIILETPSNKEHPTMSWESPEKLSILCKEMERAGISKSRVGICIDTAHVYAGGAKFATRNEAVKYIQYLPHEWIKLIHLNGNEYEYPKGNDKHAIPGSPDDAIWKGKKYNESGVFEFVELAKLYHIPIIFEAKSKHTISDIKAFIKICGRI
jgi:endonuclease IV